VAVGRVAGQVKFTSLSYLPDMVEPHAQRPREQAWRSLVEVARSVARNKTETPPPT
jgi:hypothetical protein